MSEAGPDTRRSLARFVLRGGAIALVARLLVVICGLLIQMLLARLVPPEELGAYFLAQSMVLVLALTAQLGLHRVLVRMVAQAVGADDRPRARALVSTIVPLVLFATAALGVVWVLGAGAWISGSVFHSPPLEATVLVTCAWLVAASVQQLLSEALRGFHQIGRASMLGGALTNLFAAAVLAAVFVGVGRAEFVQVLWITVAATSTNVVIGAVWLAGQMRGVPGGEAVPARVLLASAFPAAVAALVNQGIAQADLWLVGGFLDTEMVGLYGAAKRLMRLVGVPLITINMVLPPLIADLYARGEKQRLERAVRGAATLAALPSALVLAVLLLASESVLGAIFGDFYRGASLILAMLSVERLVFVWVGPCSQVLFMTGHERQVMNTTLIAGALTVGLALVLVRIWGAAGVAAAFMAGGLMRNILMWQQARIATGLRTHIDLLHLDVVAEALRRALKR